MKTAEKAVCPACFTCLLPFCFQSKELRTQNEQLLLVNTSLGSDVGKLQKQLEQVRSQQGGGGQLTSLQDELERMREELQEASVQRKKLEEEHSTEKLGLEQVKQLRHQESSLCSLLLK